jgi:hypothetical protein
MALDIQKALAAGYSEAELVDHFAKDSTLDVAKARQAGYTDTELLGHFAKAPAAPAAPVAPPTVAPKVGQGKNAGIPMAEPDESGNFMRGLGNVPGQFQETWGGAKALAGLLTKSKDLIQSGLESMEEGKMRQTGKESDSFTNAWKDGIGSVLTEWLPYQIGSGVGNLAETGTFMLLGAVGGGATTAGVGALPGAVAGAVSKTLVKQGIKEAAEKVAKESGEAAAKKFIEAETKRVITEAGAAAGKQYAKTAGKKIGATAGMVGQAGISGAGEVTGRAIDEAGGDVDQVSLGRVVPAAIAHGVADFFVNKIGLNALKIGEKSLGNLALDIGKQIAITGTKEVPAEMIQTLAERYGAKLSLTDAEAVKEYVDTIAASYGMSVGPGAVGGARTNLARKFSDAAKESTTAEDQLRKQATSAADQTQAPPPPVNPDLVAGLTPSTGADNKALANVSADTTAAGAELKAIEDAKAAEEAGKVKTAEELLAKVDAGESVKRNDIHAIAKSLGVKLPLDARTNKDKIELIRAHVGQQGAPNAGPTVSDTSGTSPSVAAPTSTEQPTTASTTGTQPSGVVSDGATTPAAPVGKEQQPAALEKPKTIEDLSPELQEDIARRKDELAEIESEKGTGNKLYKNKLNYLNKLLADNGVTGTLSAKPTVSELPRIIGPGDEKTDQQLEAERQTAYEESLGKPIPNYEISDEDKRLYNETRDEVNSQVDAANARRRELVAAVDKATDDFENAEEGKAENDAWDRLVAAEKALKDHGEEQHMLPEYEKKFAADYKDIYFGNIKYGNKGEHRQAAKALQDYMRKTGGRSKEKLSPQERRIVNHYEENRTEYQKMFGVEFPAWSKLTPEQKLTFAQEMINNSGQQQNVAFAKLGVKLVQDSREMSEGEKREKQNIIDRQEQVRQESEQQQEKDRKTREAYNRNAPPATSLPNKVVQMVMNNDLQGILEYMSDVKTSALTSPYKRIMKSVAQSLRDMKLNTKIKLVEDLDGDLAQYDPATDTIYVTQEGLSNNTILHEIVHAGTTKVINEYLYGNRKSLSMGQLNAIKQLEKIMNETRASLATDHPEAYKNLFEFVSYALTSDQLQQDLHDEQEVSRLSSATKKLPPKPPYAWEDTENIGTNLPGLKSQWSKFKLQIARILKVRDVYLKKSGEINENADVNYVMEIGAAFEDILSKPTEPVFLPALPARGKQGAAKQPAAKKTVNLHKAELGVDNAEYHTPKEDAPPTIKERYNRMRGNINTWRNTARVFQDDRYRIKSHDRILDLSGKLIREGKDKMNNVYEQIVLAVGDGKNFFNMYVQQPASELDAAVKAFADATGYKTKRAIEELHKILEAMHEPERRMVKYLLTVPLSTKENLIHNGKKISAAARRADIVKLLDAYALTPAQAQQLREELDSIVFEKDANGELVRDPDGNPKPNMTYVDPAGSTPKPRNIKAVDVKRGIDITSEAYTATGIDLTDAKKIRDDLKNYPHAAEVQRVADSIQQLHLATTELNKLANYWSQPVSNRVAFYGFENYIPLKGNPKHSDVDEDIDFDSVRNGRELQDRTGAMEGRTSVSKNPILQTMTDATRASLRAGRRNLTQAIKNAITNKDASGNTVIKGYVKKTIKFEERDTVDLSDLKGETTIFHYNEDGSIDVLVVSDKNLRDSIRRTYTKTSALTEFANKWTSAIGQMHTRYNYNFAPLNFVRDALTNTWNIGASELGPAEAARYLKNVAFLAANGGMYKAMQVAILFPKGDVQSMRALETLAKKDPYIRDMVEYIRQGGMVSHLNGMSLESNFQELHKKVGSSGILKTVDDINHFADVWTNMFELASRAAAYSVAKNRFIHTDKLSEAEAKTKAAVFTKNLANFEQVGEWGKAMGAAYMFFRPAATGAVRAIEAVAPAFTSLDAAEKRLPPEIAQDPAAKAKYLENYKTLQHNSRLMSAALFGLGLAAYTMAFMTADDDDLGRNAVATDNMEQWTRFARFHVPRGISEAMGLKEPLIFQIPWGFGLGSFAAAGAQIAGVVGGSQKITEALPNIFVSVALDSFVPIPVSRIPITESPFNWFLDSIAPSTIRPILEFTMNKNGLGRDINSTAQRRMGDAYTGGDNIPELWKDVARWTHDVTDGYLDVSPNTLYFLTNSYVDGVSRIGEAAYGISDVATGRKEFNPKTDLPLFGSFFGSRSSVDAREFAKVEREIQHMEKVINDFKTQPEKYAEYTAKYPMDEAVVEIYNKMINQELNPLRAEDKTIRLDRNLTPADRSAILKINKFQEDLVKRQMIDVFKSYGVEP